MIKLNGTDFDDSTLKQGAIIGKALTVEQIGGLRIGQNKGENSMTSFYAYLPLGDVFEMHTTINAIKRNYYVCECILFDLNTHKPVKKGVLSLNSFTRPNVKYADKETLSIEDAGQQFPQIPAFTDCAEGVAEYVAKYFVGKIFVPVGEIEVIKPRFDEDGVLCYCQPDKTPIQPRKIPTFIEATWEPVI